ncbi:DUF1178 family protein [Aquibium sp. A9E412]|uniref:DUF1178 family protein n=1 Tax=Aquibium sp. A9E412 TaxID=2976767 RepID=UPI0025B114BE|nr:DUF1178 family protein [Aquibium sp. A9E412]MDN2566512.1 DUF1178 family protein [Aquibium sp. A9E412]
MIRFSLVCDREHGFEAWFRNGEDYDTQRRRGLVACPECGSSKVDKALMAPAVASGRKEQRVALAMSEEQRKLLARLKTVTDKLRESADYVGDRFAEEARKIHFGEIEARGIYGEATLEEAKGLIEDGVAVLPMPRLPDERN